MSTCNSRTCQAYTECCPNIIPYICGVKGLHYPNAECSGLRFEGAEDITINQYDEFDVTDGVHAYDIDGNEIEFTAEPGSIDTDYPGVYTITYTAYGKGKPRGYNVGCGRNKILLPSQCRDVEKLEVTRIVTVKAIGLVLCKSKACSAEALCPEGDAIVCTATVCGSQAVC